jgi:hypothetical protein
MILGYDEKHEGLRGFLQSIQTSLMGFPVRFLVTTRNMRVFVVLFSSIQTTLMGFRV